MQSSKFIIRLIMLTLVVVALLISGSEVRAQNICGDNLTIDRYICSWTSYDNSCYERNWEELYGRGTGTHDEPCSPTAGDCKTDRAVCADASPKICTYGQPEPLTRDCNPGSYEFCDDPLEYSLCQG